MKLNTKCRVCGSANLIKFFDLGDQPYANSLLKGFDEKENLYPLSLSRCADCSLVQLDHTAEPEELFSQYVWVTGTSEGAQKHAENFYKKLVERSVSQGRGYVLEVASNDGVFLRPFLNNGFEVLGVDPAENIVDIALNNGVLTECAFFGKNYAKDLVGRRGRAKIVFARNVLPHVAGTRDFVGGLATVLDDAGVLAVEVHYAGVILDELHYDSIYHEHLCYFTFKTLERLLNDFKLFVFDIEKSPISGGSIIVYAKKKSAEERFPVKNYREEEARSGKNELESWQGFAERSFEHREKLLSMINDVLSSGKTLIGYGASARSSTMLNFCKINANLISVIADKNPLKQGKFTAGTRIPITSPEEAMKKRPEYILLLAWNFSDEIIKYLKKEFDYGGAFIVPLPSNPRILK